MRSAALERLRAIEEEFAKLDDQRTAAVIEARAAGHTWQEIGGALFLTDEGARKRWAKAARRAADARQESGNAVHPCVHPRPLLVPVTTENLGQRR